jgi:hypothetical protein
MKESHVDSGRVQYMVGHKAFPNHVYSYVHFFDDRIELECYGGIKIYYNQIKDIYHMLKIKLCNEIWQ